MSGKLIDQRDQLQQHVQIEGTCGGAGVVVDDRRRAPVGPLACNAEAAAFHMTEQQRVSARDTTLLQNGKALAPEGMKRMTDLSPSQMLVEHLCSSR